MLLVAFWKTKKGLKGLDEGDSLAPWPHARPNQALCKFEKGLSAVKTGKSEKICKRQESQNPKMRAFLLNILVAASLVAAAGPGTAERDPHDSRAVMLNSVPNLVFKRGEFTASGGRNKPLPQLNCLSGSACNTEFEPSTVLCTNIGKDYATGDPAWKCTSEVVEGLRLGKTDVVCEGFRTRDDPWILRGSCALDYTLEGTVAPHVKNRQHPNYAGREKPVHGAPRGTVPPAEGTTSLWNLILLGFLVWFVWRWIAAATEPIAAVRTEPVVTIPVDDRTRTKPVIVNEVPARDGGAGFWQGLGLGGLGAYLYNLYRNSGREDNRGGVRVNDPAYRSTSPVNPAATTTNSTSSYATTSRRREDNSASPVPMTYAESVPTHMADNVPTAERVSTSYGTTSRRREDDNASPPQARYDSPSKQPEAASTAYGTTRRRD